MCDVTAPRDHFIMRFMGLFLTHAQTVDTRPFFSPCACNKGAGLRLGYTLQGRSKHILSGQARKWVWLWACSGNNALNLQQLHLVLTVC